MLHDNVGTEFHHGHEFPALSALIVEVLSEGACLRTQLVHLVLPLSGHRPRPKAPYGRGVITRSGDFQGGPRRVREV